MCDNVTNKCFIEGPYNNPTRVKEVIDLTKKPLNAIWNKETYGFCYLIEIIGRYSKNHRADIINKLGYKNIKDLLETSLYFIRDMKNEETLASELIERFRINIGVYDNVTQCITREIIPNVEMVSGNTSCLIECFSFPELDKVEVLIELYNSWLYQKMENLNGWLCTMESFILAGIYCEGKNNCKYDI